MHAILHVTYYIFLLTTLQADESLQECHGSLSSEPSSETGSIFMHCYSLFGAIYTNSF